MLQTARPTPNRAAIPAGSVQRIAFERMVFELAACEIDAGASGGTAGRVGSARNRYPRLLIVWTKRGLDESSPRTCRIFRTAVLTAFSVSTLISSPQSS